MPKIISNTTNNGKRIPTPEELRHLYGDVTNYVKGLAAKARRLAERAGKSDKARAIDEDLKLITDDLDQALNEDVANVDAGRQPYTHDALKDVMRKRFNSFSELVDEYLGEEDDEDDEEEASKPAKAKRFYLIDGRTTIPVSDDSALPAILVAHDNGKSVQLVTISEKGVPSFTTIVEAAKKSKKKYDDSDDGEEDDDTGSDESNDSDDGSKRGKLSITHDGKTRVVSSITLPSGSGKSKKSITYVLATEDGTKVFKSVAQANASYDDVVWYEVTKKAAGMAANGKRKYKFTLSTSNPDKIPYDPEDD